MANDKAVTHNLFTYHNKQTTQQYFNCLFIHSDGFFTFSYAWTWGTGWWHHVLDLLYHNPEELQQNEKRCPLSLILLYGQGLVKNWLHLFKTVIIIIIIIYTNNYFCSSESKFWFRQTCPQYKQSHARSAVLVLITLKQSLLMGQMQGKLEKH